MDRRNNWRYSQIQSFSDGQGEISESMSMSFTDCISLAHMDKRGLQKDNQL